MKKLMILALVVSMASLASAGLDLTATGGTATVIGFDNTIALGGFLVSTGGTVDGGTMIFTGSLAELGDLTPAIGFDEETDALVGALQGIHGIVVSQLFALNFADGSGLLPNGDLATFNAVTGSATLMLIDGDTLEQMGSSVTVPEPMTMALLGLGGLFLRRRK